MIDVYVFQSLRVAQRYSILNSSCSALDCWSSAKRRSTRLRLSSERNFASSGKSWTVQNDAIPIAIVAKPSRIKIHAQPGLPPTPFILAMAAARSPPNDPATAAKEKKMAIRIPNSDRLYQQESKYDTPGNRPDSVTPKKKRAAMRPP